MPGESTMYDRRELLDALHEVGARELGVNGSGHCKYILPDGLPFSFSSTPSDLYSYKNAIKELVRRCESQYPHLRKRYVERHGAKHISLMRSSRNIGSLIDKKDQERLHSIAPGYVKPEDRTIPIHTIQPSQYVEPELLRHRTPRKERTHSDPASPVKTLTQEQLAEANRVLNVSGKAAMDEYINRCHDSLVEATPEIIATRIAPLPTTQTAGIMDNQIEDLINRSRMELEAT
jgi:hypothetical protein